MKSINGLKILVTGGAGYIGSQTCKALHRTGFEPVVFDNLSTGHRWAVKWGPFIKGNLLDRCAVKQALIHSKIDGVVHFAACTNVGESMSNAQKYLENNVAGTLNLLGAMLEAGVDKIVFSSSCAIYGIPERVPITVDHRPKPINPYGESKSIVEKMLHWFGVVHGFSWAALRYFNAAGADTDGELGEVHIPETHLIPLVIEAALSKRPSVEVFGTDYPTQDGTAIRDYIHVADLADAHVKALHHLFSGGKSLAFNLGTGRGHSVLEVIDTVERIGGRSVPHRHGPRRAGDPPELVADPAAALETLRWSPKWGLADIIQTAWQWHSSFKP